MSSYLETKKILSSKTRRKTVFCIDFHVHFVGPNSTKPRKAKGREGVIASMGHCFLPTIFLGLILQTRFLLFFRKKKSFRNTQVIANHNSKIFIVFVIEIIRQLLISTSRKSAYPEIEYLHNCRMIYMEINKL